MIALAESSNWLTEPVGWGVLVLALAITAAWTWHLLR